MSKPSPYKKVIVTVIDSTTIKLNAYGIALFKEVFSYTAVYYAQVGFKKVRKEYQKSLIENNGSTYLGFYFRIKKFCKENSIPLELDDEYSLTGISREGKIANLHLYGKTLRDDQKNLVQKALRRERGVIKAPTGTGKTVMLMGLMSCYPKTYKWLLFVPTLSILSQTVQELEDHKFKNIITLGGKTGHKDFSTDELVRANIIVTTSSSFLNLLKDRENNHWHDRIDAVVIDECHLGMKPDGRFNKIFKELITPIRYGLTATLPNDADACLGLEGLLGPVIADMTIADAAELELLAKPTVKLLTVPVQSKLSQEKDYNSIVDMCLVNNQSRNDLIIRAVKRLMQLKKSVLIFVNKIEHGVLLNEQLEEKGIHNIFVQGATDNIQREEIRQQMNKKNITVVIATVVWREGVNIPSLDSAILAGGGKTTSGTIQSIGRALRKTKGKEKALVIDFLDPYRYLAEHTVQRIGIYTDKKWL